MEDNINQDVNIEVADTSPESSTETETSAVNDEVNTAGAVETGVKDKTIPYDRFSEVNTELKSEREARIRMEMELNQLKSKPGTETKPLDPQLAQVKDQLRQLGFVSQEDIDRDFKQREADRQVQDEISRLEKTYDGSDGRPPFKKNDVIKFALEHSIGDLETAYEKKHRESLINWHIEQAISKSKGIKSEASDGSGSNSVGTTNADLKEAIKKGDKDALRVFLKRQFTSGNK